MSTWDTDYIERGRHLIYGPAHCVACHGDPDLEARMLSGEEIPLSGGRRIFLGRAGVVVAPNLTSDKETGIGALDDATLMRSLRHHVNRHGRPLLPLMGTAGLAEYDRHAILSYLRSVEPIVASQEPRQHLSLLGKVGAALLLRPQVPRATAGIAPSRSASYGRYLVEDVANCRGCHTRRSATGAFVGQELAGGNPLQTEHGVFVPPSLTADGVLSRLGEREFIALFRLKASLQSRSPMPWFAFGRMSDDELAAIYLYLKSLPVSTLRHGDGEPGVEEK